MRIGIFGGAFDPIHVGHLALARAAFEKLKLDTIFFVPCHQPPSGPPAKCVAPSNLRFEMVGGAISGIAGFEISDAEVKREGVSYTIDTLREFKKNFSPPNELFFVAGGDWEKDLSRWKDIDEIFSLCHFYIAKRPGYEGRTLPNSVRFLDFEPIDISSTQIRKMIRDGQPVGPWLPKAVLEIIQKHRLYFNS